MTMVNLQTKVVRTATESTAIQRVKPEQKAVVICFRKGEGAAGYGLQEIEHVTRGKHTISSLDYSTKRQHHSPLLYFTGIACREGFFFDS